MKKTASQPFVVGLALALSALNIVVLIIGARWVHGVVKSFDAESAVAATQRFEGALYLLLFCLILLGSLGLSAAAFRSLRRQSRASEDAEIRSYTRNLARAKRRARRGSGRRSSGRRNSSG